MSRGLQKTFRAAVAHHQAGRLSQAEALYRRIIAGQPNEAETLRLLGVIAHQRGCQEEAEQWARQAISACGRPVAEFCNTLGAVLAAQGKPGEAVRCYQEAVALKQDYSEAHQNLGRTLAALGRMEEAAPHFEKALHLRPGDATAHHDMGSVFAHRKMAAEAMACFEKAVQLDPRNADAWNNLGNMRRARGRVAEAIVCVQKALALQPGFAAAYSNLGVMLHEQGKVDEAILSLQQALALEPNDAAAWSNLGNCLMEAQRFAEALSGYDRAIELQPGFLRARWHRSLVLFMTGEIERGWIEYEWGWADGQRTQPRPFGQPRWDGSPLIGTRLLFWGEQGVGDEIIWAGMIPELGDRHIVECEPRLVPLFARSFPGVEVIPREIPPHPTTALADLQIPAASAGRWLRASLDRFPRHHGYLRADPERVAHWRQRLDTLGPGLAIGICWRSGVTAGLRNLSCTNLQQWGSVLSVPGVHFINLQYDECRAELDQARAHFGVRIHEFSGIDLRQDLDDVAALTTALDLVVSTTTAVADMAGALGRPVWVLMLTSAGHGFTMGQHYVPWFPSMRLYERTWNEPWEPVLKRLSQDLADLASREAAVPDTAPTLWPLLPSGR